MTYHYKYNHTLVPFSQQNKRNQTEAERRLWFHLRGRQLNGSKFRRQYPIFNYILDFYCIEKKLAIELDGSQHLQNKTYDDIRTRKLKNLGIHVLRFFDNDVFNNIDGVLETIVAELENTTSS